MTTALTKSTLPSIRQAKLPIVYKEAVIALARCARVDECKDWADKAVAIASYARQARDETLLNTATRIKARAIRRVGEMLQDLPDEQGKRHDLTSERRTPEVESRAAVALRAGLSRDQQKQALRIAAIPDAKFEKLVEAAQPPTLTELARIGIKPREQPDHLQGRTHKDFQAALHAQAALREFVLDTETERFDLDAVMRGTEEDEVKEFDTNARQAITWLTRLRAKLEKKK